MPNITLLVVDDHSLVREALIYILQSINGFSVVGEARDGESAVLAYQKCKPDVTLLDVRLPGMDGFDTLSRLKFLYPAAAVIMLSTSIQPQEVVRARQLGARAFVAKQLGFCRLRDAIEKVANGKDAWDGHEKRSSGDHNISARELHVLECARRGLSNSEIGVALHISEHTVKSHIKNILQKLHAAGRAEAVARGFELGLLQ